MNFINKFKLSREAILFDSPLYLFKAFLGIMTCYLLFSHHTIIGKDMISVLFGMMLSLEPVNISGIKSGFAQFEATILGGLVTAVIVTVGGVNMITVPLAVMMTLYISILLDWKNISPVAFFTSIYMTQLIQYTAAGDPSMLLTFRLRIMALGAGVLIAILFNFIFSLLFYKSMVRKRTIYIFEKLIAYLGSYEAAIRERDMEALNRLKREVPALFTDIDFIYGHVYDLSKEKHKSVKLKNYLTTISEMRNLNHYFFDMIIHSLEENFQGKIEEDFVKTLHHLEAMMKQTVTRLEDKLPSESMAIDHVIHNANLKKVHGCIVRIDDALGNFNEGF